MLAQNLLIVVFLLSNITLASGFLDVLAAVGSYLVNLFVERDSLPFDTNRIQDELAALGSYLVNVYLKRDGLLPFDTKRLEADLNKSLFGQHIVSDVVLKAVSSFMADRNPNKPLVLSFHGTTGVGKNHVAKIIARNIYQKGENSKHVHTFTSELNFPHREHSHIYSANLKKLILHEVYWFPRSIFIFDEMDKMNPQLIDTLKPFLDYNDRVHRVSFRNAIFIFLSNAGGNVIVETALDFWREGKKREEIRMNSKELETKISQNILNDKNSGFQHSSLIDHHLVDHYIPFLPLELKHVRQCVMAEMVNLNMTEDFGLADKVARDMPFFPEKEKIFSVKGCKSVRQKLFLYSDE